MLIFEDKSDLAAAARKEQEARSNLFFNRADSIQI